MGSARTARLAGAVCQPNGEQVSASSSDAVPIDLLWTGGWDSTFQLLRMLAVQKVPVSPLYLIDEDRRSTGAELLAMKRIKAHLRAHFPRSAELLSPTRFYSVADIAPNPIVTAAYGRLSAAAHLGGQYEWLARFAEERGLVNLQMCVHKAGSVDHLVRGVVRRTTDAAGATFGIPTEVAGSDEHALFHRFSLPLLDLTKPEMAQSAAESGLMELLNMTWFCHNPKWGMKPCGRCNTCLGAIAHGNGWRIPIERRGLSLIARAIIRPSWTLARNVRNRLRRYLPAASDRGLASSRQGVPAWGRRSSRGGR